MSDSSSPIIYRWPTGPRRAAGGWEERLRDNPIQKNPEVCQENQKFFISKENKTNKCSGAVASPSLMHSKEENGAFDNNLYSQEENFLITENLAEHNSKIDQATTPFNEEEILFLQEHNLQAEENFIKLQDSE
jgi:hypothetical protein